MIHPMPVAKEILEDNKKVYHGMAVLLRHLTSRNSELVQKSSEVLQEIGDFAVPFLVYTLNGSKNREVSMHVIDVLEKMGPGAWQQALPQLYHKIRENADPVVCDRLIQAFRCLTPYRRPGGAVNRSVGQEEQPPQADTLPDESSTPPMGVGALNKGRTPSSPSKSRRRAKPARGRSSSERPSIPPDGQPELDEAWINT